MVRGEAGRVPLYRFKFGTDVPKGPEYIDRAEMDKFVGMESDDEDLFLFGCRPEYREQVIREEPCLVRQDDGRFVAVNPELGRPVYLVD